MWIDLLSGMIKQVVVSRLLNLFYATNTAGSEIKQEMLQYVTNDTESHLNLTLTPDCDLDLRQVLKLNISNLFSRAQLFKAWLA